MNEVKKESLIKLATECAAFALNNGFKTLCAESVMSMMAFKERSGYDDWILDGYLSSKDTVWSNPENKNELITLRQNGGMYFTYPDNIKVGDIVKWEDVPDNSLVRDDFAFEYGNSSKWIVFYKARGCFSYTGDYKGDCKNLVISERKWNDKQSHSPKVQIIALNLIGTESPKEITEKFLNQ